MLAAIIVIGFVAVLGVLYVVGEHASTGRREYCGPWLAEGQRKGGGVNARPSSMRPDACPHGQSPRCRADRSADEEALIGSVTAMARIVEWSRAEDGRGFTVRSPLYVAARRFVCPGWTVTLIYAGGTKSVIRVSQVSLEVALSLALAETKKEE